MTDNVEKKNTSKEDNIPLAKVLYANYYYILDKLPREYQERLKKALYNYAKALASGDYVSAAGIAGALPVTISEQYYNVYKDWIDNMRYTLIIHVDMM
jgi:predicted hydrocarbon binding protein